MSNQTKLNIIWEDDDHPSESLSDINTEENNEEIPIMKTNIKMPKGENIESYHFQFNSILAIAGQTGAGKTQILREILRVNRNHFDRIIVVSSTADILNNKDYDFVTKANMVHPENIDKITKIVKFQCNLVKNGHKYRLCLVFDDFIGHLKTHQCDVLDKLATSGRHYSITTFYLCQHLTKLSPTIRENVKYWVVSKVQRSGITDVLSQYQGTYNKYQLFDVYDNWTRSKRFAFIIMQSNDPYSNEISFMNPVIPKKWNFFIK